MKIRNIIFEELTKTEVREIAKEEAEKLFRKLLKSELEDHLVKLLKKRSGLTREEISNIAKDDFPVSSENVINTELSSFRYTASNLK